MNPSGSFVEGGPSADCGVTGRKIIVDSYGGVGRHGGGAFSGKDPSKVDKSGAYFCRHVARALIASGLARRAELQVSYAIGQAAPVSVKVDTFGTGDEAAAAVRPRVRLSARPDHPGAFDIGAAQQVWESETGHDVITAPVIADRHVWHNERACIALCSRRFGG